jgi:hypothetical protein
VFPNVFFRRIGHMETLRPLLKGEMMKLARIRNTKATYFPSYVDDSSKDKHTQKQA